MKLTRVKTFTAETWTKGTTGTAYVEIGDLTFFFDDSTGKVVIEWWKTKEVKKMHIETYHLTPENTVEVDRGWGREKPKKSLNLKDLEFDDLLSGLEAAEKAIEKFNNNRKER